MLARGLHFARTQISFLSKRDRLATFTSHFILIRPVCFPPMRSYQSLFLSLPSPLPSDPPGKLQFQRIRRERAKCARAPERISRAEFFNANNSSAGWYDEHVNGFSLGVNVFLSFFFFFVFVFFFSFSETLELLGGGGFYGFWYSDSLFLCVDFNVSSLSFSLCGIKTQDS